MHRIICACVFTAVAAAQQPGSLPLPLPFAGDDYRISAALGDVDGDGVGDLVVGRNGRFDVLRGLPGPARRFADEPRPLGREVGPSCESGGAPQLVDVDGDGDLDLLTIDAPLGTRQRVVWFANAGDGTFAAARTMLDAAGAPLHWDQELSAAQLCDWDGDGHVDLLVASPRLLIHRGGPGGLATSADELGAASRSFVAMDWDGDGDLDLLTAADGELSLQLRGEGGFEPAVAITAVGDIPSPACLAACDWDGDGQLDVLLGEHREVAPVVVPPRVASERTAQLEAAERVVAAVEAELRALVRTPLPRGDAEAMARRKLWYEELARWSEAPRQLRDRLREAQRTAGRPSYHGALRVWIR